MKPFLLVLCAALAAAPAVYAAPFPGLGEPAGLLPPHALACGAPTLDVSQYDLVGVHETGKRHPDVPADRNVLTFTLEQWTCIFPTESADLQGIQVQPTEADIREMDRHGFHPVSEVGAAWDEGYPAAGNYDGYMKIVIFLPDPSDALYPSEGCNWHDVGQAMIWLNENVGGGTYERWCYYVPSPGWNSGGDTNTNNNLNRLHDYVHASQQHWIDDQNELVLGVLEKMDNNGVAWLQAKVGILAQYPTSGVNLYDDSIVLHEVSHNFGAVHSGWDPHVCGGEVSVMNYCYIGWMHAHTYDSGNDDIVQGTYWSCYGPCPP